jgi:hypothetical protein
MRAHWPDTAGRTFKPFLFGTVFADDELAAERGLLNAWDEICPHRPIIEAIIPGALFFCENQEGYP